MRIAIVGHGALGALYGHAFSSVRDNQVIFVTNRERAAGLKARPLTVNGETFDYDVESPENSTGTAGLIIFAVKYHHLPQALEDARAHAGKDTIFVSVMNGIDSEELIAEVYGNAHVLHTVALGMDAVRVGSRVDYTTPGRLLFGRADRAGQVGQAGQVDRRPGNRQPESDADLRTFAELCDRAGISYQNPPDILRSLWSKFMLNIGVNQVSAVLEAPYGPFQRETYAQQLMRQAMEETVTVAEALKIELHRQDIEDLIDVLKTLSPEGKTSMYQDIAAGRKTEVEMFAGKLIDLAESHVIEVPVNRVLFSIIKAKEELALPTTTGP